MYIACGRTARGAPYPALDGYVTIPAWSRGAQPWCNLSPMRLGPVWIQDPADVVRPGFSLMDGSVWAQATCFENYWQGSKIYQVDLVDATLPVTVENLKPAFWTRRAEVFASVKPVRRALPKARYGVPIAGYYEGEVMDYVTSRVRIYAPFYSRLVVDTPEFQQLLFNAQSGVPLLLVGPDGYDHQVPLTVELLQALILDPSIIFGHELVLCGMLLGIEY